MVRGLGLGGWGEVGRVCGDQGVVPQQLAGLRFLYPGD